MLDRYKKKGGFHQLLSLIETSGKQKQEQFLALISQESPVWEEAIRQKMLTMDKILSWETGHLREVFSRIQPLTLATATHGLSAEKISLVLSCMSASDQKKIQLVLDESKPTPAEVGTCIMKIITETRGIISGGLIKLEKIDQSLVIQENIEEFLTSQGVSRPEVNSSESKVATPSGDEIKSGGPQETQSSDGKVDSNREEVDFLKRKITQLGNENAALKQEMTVLKSKLEQIKKIA